MSIPALVAATRLESTCSTSGKPAEELCAPSSPIRGVTRYGELAAPLRRPLTFIPTPAGIKVKALNRPLKAPREAVLVMDERLRLVGVRVPAEPLCSGCAKEALARAVAKEHHGLWQFANGFRGYLSIQSGPRRLTVRPSAAAGRFSVHCDGTDIDGWSRPDAAKVAATYVAIDLVHALHDVVPWKESCGTCQPILAVVDEPAS